MAILRDQKVYWDAYDLTGKLNALSLEYGAEAQDDTTLGDTFRSSTGGLITVAAQVEGFWETGTGTFEPALMNNLGVQDKPFTVTHTSTEGIEAWFFKMMEGDYSPFKSAVGDLHTFSAGGVANSALIKGKLLANKTVTATSNGTAFSLGAASSSQKLYVATHILAVSGTNPTLDIIIQSDSASNFPSSADVITFDQKTSIGSDWEEASGAITDTWYRVRYVVGGTNPSFTFITVAGIR